MTVSKKCRGIVNDRLKEAGWPGRMSWLVAGATSVL
jgi:hypothetical protein